MMTQKRKRYDRQFKISAAQVVPSGDMTVRELSEELQIKDPALRRWAQEYEAMGDGAFPGNGSPKTNKDHGIATHLGCNTQFGALKQRSLRPLPKHQL